MLKTDHLEKDETTTPLSVGSPSNPSGHYRSHFGSSASDHAQAEIFEIKGYRRSWMCGVNSTTLHSMPPVPVFELHLSLLTPMLTQCSSMLTLTYTTQLRSSGSQVFLGYRNHQSPFQCSDVLPPSRMSSANNVLASEPSLPPSSCRRARRRDPG